MTYKKNYKCQIHVTNEGFFDEDGNWICWICHQLDIFNKPDGKILLEFERDDFYLRLVDSSNSNGNIQVELFHNKKRIKNERYRDMSTGVRGFGRFKSDIIAGGIAPPREIPNTNIVLPTVRNPIVLHNYNASQFVAVGDDRQYVGMRIQHQSLTSTPNSHTELFKCLLINCVVRRVRLVECIIAGSTVLEQCELFDCGIFSSVSSRDCSSTRRLFLPNNLEIPLIEEVIGFSSVLAFLHHLRLEQEEEEELREEERNENR